MTIESTFEMNPFYSHTHNHLTSMSQFSSPTPPPNLTSLPSHLVQHQQSQHIQSNSPQQFLQPQSQSSAAVVAAAASFYASRNNSDNFNRRHIQNINSSMQSSPSSSTSNTPVNYLSSSCFFFLLQFKSKNKS